MGNNLLVIFNICYLNTLAKNAKIVSSQLFWANSIYFLGVSVGTYSQYFTTWVCLLFQELRPLNPFPSRDIIQRNMPSCFHSFPNLRVILDCTEIFVQKSSSLVNQNLSFSHYKHHTTVKFLIGITPSGVISLVSEGFGGSV